MNQHILGDKKKSTFDDNLADIVNEIYDKMPEKSPESKFCEVKTDKFYVKETDTTYVLHNVPHYGQLFNFFWDKKLLNNGNPHTQDEWVKLTEKLPDLSVYFSNLRALYKGRTGLQADLIEKIRQMFADDFQNNIMTCSRAKYKQIIKDEIIHDYGLDSKNIVYFDFVGKWKGSVFVALDSEEGIALLGDPGYKQIQEISKWATGKIMYTLRAYEEAYYDTESEYERVVILESNEKGFFINADANIFSCKPARGVTMIGKSQK